ncbi:MAG TPA: hypothetical protein VK819_06405, partial [Acidobacteriaceae bacterium]|nr:hypothetical protein [Acidobacteriaceae bacterium]
SIAAPRRLKMMSVFAPALYCLSIPMICSSVHRLSRHPASPPAYDQAELEDWRQTASDHSSF